MVEIALLVVEANIAHLAMKVTDIIYTQHDPGGRMKYPLRVKDRIHILQTMRNTLNGGHELKYRENLQTSPVCSGLFFPYHVNH
jgi:hypothetical protein